MAPRFAAVLALSVLGRRVVLGEEADELWNTYRHMVPQLKLRS